MGRVCHWPSLYGPSLLWAEFVMGRVCYGPSCPVTLVCTRFFYGPKKKLIKSAQRLRKKMDSTKMSHVEHLKQLHDLELYQDLKQFVSFPNILTDFRSNVAY